MYWTTNIQVATNLVTNSWNGDNGRTNILFKAQIKNSGQEVDTVETRSDQSIMHQTSIDSIRSFQLFLLDQYDKPLRNFTEVEVDLVVLF